MTMKWLCIIAGAMAILAILPGWSYSYYQLLRWVLFISSVMIGYGFYQSKLQGWALAFGAIAFLFNPIFPVFMNKASWTGIDLITGLVFLIASGSTKKKKS